MAIPWQIFINNRLRGRNLLLPTDHESVSYSFASSQERDATGIKVIATAHNF